MIRRCISVVVAVFMLANLMAWPSAGLAEALEHEQEFLELLQAPERAPAQEPAPCQHSCAGHCAHHFLWISLDPSRPGPVSGIGVTTVAPRAPSPYAVPDLPFRPPLPASIRS